MAVRSTGNMNKLDKDAIADIIVFANALRQVCDTSGGIIKETCKAMEEEEYLKGGDADAIRECFVQISEGATHLMNSMAKVSSQLNESLGKVLDLQRGRQSGSMAEDMQAKAKKVGRFGKQ